MKVLIRALPKLALDVALIRFLLLWLSSSRWRAKFFPHNLHSHGRSNPLHGSLVDGKGIVVVDDNLADRAADGRLRFRLVLLLLHLGLAGVALVVDPLVFEKQCLRIHFS